MTFIGQTHEIAALLEPGRPWAEARIKEFFATLAEETGVILSPARFTEGTDQDLGAVLVGEVDVLGFIPEPTALTDDLDNDSLQRLRTVTRHAHSRRNPKAARLTDAECDVIINEVAPGTAVEDVLRGTVH